MRLAGLLINASLAAVVIAIVGAAGASAQERTPLAARVALLLPQHGLRGNATPIVPAQLSSCYPPGAQRCINGWVWTCQCYSYGCSWTTGSQRCR